MDNIENKKTILVGNTYPPSLIRRKVTFNPITLEKAKEILQHAYQVSFWGHTNTLKVASNVLGIDLTPIKERPEIELNSDKLPTLFGLTTDTVLVLSPEYPKGYRPPIGAEVSEENILGWQCLLVQF